MCIIMSTNKVEAGFVQAQSDNLPKVDSFMVFDYVDNLSKFASAKIHWKLKRVEVTKKTKAAARLWKERWGFFSRIKQIQEEQALNIGMSREEYRAAVQSVNCQPEPQVYPMVDPSPSPMPTTSSGMIGRRALCPLERYGRLVKTPRDFPIRPPPRKTQIYDPFKQTLVFLGSVDGDPISYKLPPARSEVTEEMWTRPHQLEVMALCKDNLERALTV